MLVFVLSRVLFINKQGRSGYWPGFLEEVMVRRSQLAFSTCLNIQFIISGAGKSCCDQRGFLKKHKFPEAMDTMEERKVYLQLGNFTHIFCIKMISP